MLSEQVYQMPHLPDRDRGLFMLVCLQRTGLGSGCLAKLEKLYGAHGALAFVVNQRAGSDQRPYNEADDHVSHDTRWSRLPIGRLKRRLGEKYACLLDCRSNTWVETR